MYQIVQFFCQFVGTIQWTPTQSGKQMSSGRTIGFSVSCFTINKGSYNYWHYVSFECSLRFQASRRYRFSIENHSYETQIFSIIPLLLVLNVRVADVIVLMICHKQSDLTWTTEVRNYVLKNVCIDYKGWAQLLWKPKAVPTTLSF